MRHRSRRSQAGPQQLTFMSRSADASSEPACSWFCGWPRLVCLAGALAINGLTARLGWQLYLVLLTVGILAGLFAVAARRLLLAPQGKVALGFLGLTLLFASWIAPALGLVALGVLGIIGLLCSISWPCQLLWEQATLLSKNRETKPHQQ